MKIFNYLLIGLATISTSCVESSTKYKELAAQNNELRLANVKFTDEVNEMLSTLEEVEANFEAIKTAENYIAIHQDDNVELGSSRRERVSQNMQIITETLEKNKEKIANLEEQLRKSGVQSSALKKTIERLSNELDQKSIMVAQLQEELANKNIRINELDNMVSTLNKEVGEISSTAQEQKEKLEEQDKAMHTVFYCFGTSKELKAQKIITGGGLFSKTKVLQDGFNKEYFIKTDLRKTKDIQLFASKAKVMSNHPEDSFEFIEDEDSNLTLVILDEQQFWSMSKYLVIQVG